MDTVLFLAHAEHVALDALAAARALGGRLVVGLAGGDPQPAADRIASCGADRFLAVSGELFRVARYATDAAAADALVRTAGASLVIAPSTSRWSRVLAGVAGRLGGSIDTHVTAVEPGPAVKRWYYRQRMEAVIRRDSRPWFI